MTGTKLKVTVLYDLWEEEPAEVEEEVPEDLVVLEGLTSVEAQVARKKCLRRAGAKGKRNARRSR